MRFGRVAAAGVTTAVAFLLPAGPAAAACETVSLLNLDGSWVRICADGDGVDVCSGREEIGCDG